MNISVILPTYNPQDYLWDCLDSLCNQTLKHTEFEVLIILNGCREPFQTDIEKYLLSHKVANFRLFQTNIPGVSNARNLGLDNCIGKYVTFIDDDDMVSPCYLEELLKHASEDTIALSYSFAFNDYNPEVLLRYYTTDAYDYCVKVNHPLILSSRIRSFFSVPVMKLIPRSYIGDRRFDVRFKNGEDALFMFLISDRFQKFCFTPREAIYYRRFRENSAVTAKRSFLSRAFDLFKFVSAILSIYIKNWKAYNFVFLLTRILAQFKSLF